MSPKGLWSWQIIRLKWKENQGEWVLFHFTGWDQGTLVGTFWALVSSV